MPGSSTITHSVIKIIEAIDTLDRITPQVVTFSDNPKLAWMFRYQGSMSLAQINNITVQSFVGNELVLQNLPVIPASRVLFEPNDIIQIGSYTYPFTSTTQVLRLEFQNAGSNYTNATTTVSGSGVRSALLER